jgi:hypothetical protein
MHGTGLIFRTVLGRTSTWQRVLIAVALIAIGAVLFALGHVRGGIVGILGVVLLWGVVHNLLRRRAPVRHADEEQSPGEHA